MSTRCLEINNHHPRVDLRAWNVSAFLLSIPVCLEPFCEPSLQQYIMSASQLTTNNVNTTTIALAYIARHLPQP